MELEFTKEEIETLKLYINERYEAINQLLVSNCETDIALLSNEVENKVVRIPYNREAVIENLMSMKTLYKIFMKSFCKVKHEEKVFYRGTNLAEIEHLKMEPYIDRILSATTDKELEEECATNWRRPVGITITLEENVPYINVGEILGQEEDFNSILISPFTRVKSIEEDKTINLDNSKYFKYYNIVLEKQELDKLTDKERNGLYNYILENCYSIKRKLDDCIKLERENTINFDNIRKMEQLLRKYETEIDEKEIDNDYSDIDRTADYNDIERVSRELSELKKISTDVFEIRKQNIEFVNMWKRNIAVYMLAECREIEEMFKDVEVPIQLEEVIETENEEKENTEVEVKVVLADEDIEPEEKVEDETEQEDNKVESEETESTESENVEEDIEEQSAEENELQKQVKQEAKENVEAVEKLLDDIQKLIAKQQNHAKVAGNMGASYSALNNAFEMKKSAELLLDQTQKIDKKVKQMCLKEFDMKAEIELKLASKTNIEISTLLNYLNNPKIAVKNSKVTRFDEMAIIEENELKRGIAQKIKDIRGEAELKKLKDDLEIIEEKGRFSRFIGLFTGKNKIDDFMIEQIQYRQVAIRKSLAKKLSLAHNYSVHELMAEITMFVNDNEDDELVEKDVTELKSLASELRNNYVILESKVQSIVEQKEGRNLPYDNRKMTKREIIEVETYRFLNKYGYDIDIKPDDEPKYQDTMASEISRISEYISSSNII